MVYISLLISHVPPAHSFFKKKIHPRKSSLNLKQPIIFMFLNAYL